jgi:uncharacterized protein (DUF3084 family)
MNMNNTPEQQEAAHLEKLRSQISTDIQAIQQKETSLREYEQRLRLLVEHTQSSQSPHPAPPPSLPAGSNTESIDAEWEKNFEQREVEVARREAWVKVREQELEAQAQVRAAELETLKEKPKSKQRSSFTIAPLVAARKMLMRHS